MSYQPLTREQFNKASETFSPAQIQLMEQRRANSMVPVDIQEPKFSPLPSTSEMLISQASQPTQPTPEPQPTERGALESFAKRPLERLVIEPAMRTTQMLMATLPLVPQSIRDTALDLSEQDTILELPLLGDFVSKGVTGAKQQAGEALETASWLYMPAKVPGMARSAVREGATLGARSGGISGALFGLGEGLQEDMTVGETAGLGVAGGAIGGIGGAAIGAAIPAIPATAKATMQTARTGYGFAESLARTMFKTAQTIGEKGAEIPERMIRRTAEDIAAAGEKAALIRNSPKHIGEALKQGFEEPLIDFLRTGTRAEKKLREEMLDIAKKASEDLSFMQSVKEVPGRVISEGPAKFLIRTAKEGTTKTNQVLDSLPKTSQDAIGLYNQFTQDMRRIGFEIKNGVMIRARGSRVPEQDERFYQEIFRELKPDAEGRVPLTFQQMDGLRDRWFKSVRADELLTDGVRNKTSGYIARVRAMLTQEIDKVAGGKYREAQQQTAEALTSLSEYARLLGYKGPIENIATKDLKAGETFMRVFGNASDRPLGVLNTLYETARKHGYKGKENIMNQLKYADILESVYGQPSRSIGAQVARAVSPSQDPSQVMASSVREMVKWSPYSGIIRLLRARGLLGKHETEVMRAFENLIRGEAGSPLQTRSVRPLEKSVGKIKEMVGEGIQKVRDITGLNLGA